MTTANTAAQLPRTSALGRIAITEVLASATQRSHKDIAAERWPAIGQDQRDLITRTAPRAANEVASIDMPATTAAGQLYVGVAQQTLLGRLRVLADVKIRSAFGGFSAGEPLGSIQEPGQPIPMLQLAFSKPVLDPITAAALVALSKEFVEDANAEAGIRDLLLRATTKAADAEFISRALNGASATNTGADSPFQLRAQVRAMVAALVAAGANVTTISLAASPTTMVTLATASDPMGNAAFPTVSLVAPSTLCGLPLLPSFGVDDGAIVAVAGDSVLRAAGSIDIARSEHARLEFSSAPTGKAEPGETPVAASGPRVSLWQAGLVALRIRFIFGADFVRATRAAFIDGITLEGGTA